MNSDNAKVQHYVPRFLLRNFGVGKKDKISVFDKQTGKCFSTNLKNVAAESRFYDFEFDGRSYTIEPSLSKIETRAKPIITKILDADSLEPLSAEEIAELSYFLAVQFSRTKWLREQFRSLRESLRTHLSAFETEWSPEFEKEYLDTTDESSIAAQSIQFLVDSPRDLAPQFANKVWVLFSTGSQLPFLIGDNPIAMQNQRNMRPFGNIGLGVKGIEVYFPLSSRRALAMWCPSHADVLPTNYRGQALKMPEVSVLNFNSLQVGYAERFVFSCNDDFSLARDMIAANVKYKTGPRAETG